MYPSTTWEQEERMDPCLRRGDRDRRESEVTDNIIFYNIRTFFNKPQLWSIMNKRMKSARQWFLQTALSYLGTPYIWGGDDPSGFDCSGFVIECLKTAGLIKEREDMTADELLKRYTDNRVNQPCKGALLFTVNKKGTATHVVICLDRYFQIGASGGTKRTNNRQESWRDNAYVKIRPIRFDRQSYIVVDPFVQKRTINIFASLLNARQTQLSTFF